MADEYYCPECGEGPFPSRVSVGGHMGGKHTERVLKPIKHGTANGYAMHKRRGIPIDDDDSCGCRTAHADYHRKRRAATRG